eukprot:4681687-Amphidinium_carterae.1
MANPADDGRSISSRHVPISVASSSNISNTSTLPRITGMSLVHRDHEVRSPNLSMTGATGSVTRQSQLQSQLQAAASQQQPTATSRLSDLTAIPEGIVQATASVFSMFRRSTPSAGTSPSHTPRQDQDVVPRYQNDAAIAPTAKECYRRATTRVAKCEEVE